MFSAFKSKYQYQPLDALSSEIRVLRMLPGKSADGLQCELQHIPLNRKANYEALSYSWQDLTLFHPEPKIPKEYLLVNGRRLGIGQNLASYLAAARAPKDKGNWIWIDAICINQGDVDERNIQVLRMREIYKLASKVIVWLGPKCNDSGAAFSFLHFVFDECPAEREATWFRALIHETPLRKEWLSLGALLSRAWWTRIWIVQEVVLAKDLVVRCGSVSLTWMELEYSMYRLAEGYDEIKLFVPELQSDSIISDRIRSLGRLAAIRRRREDLKFVDVLNNIGANDCTNVRDKVYGLLGLVKEAERLVPSPDYELGSSEVHKRLFVSLAVNMRSLEFLSLVVNRYDSQKQAMELTLPSWCPNMAWKGFNMHRLNTTLSLPANSLPQFSACGSGISDARSSEDYNILGVSGIRIDIVDGVFPGSSGMLFNLKNTHQARSNSTAYGTDKETFKALWSSLVAGLELYSTRPGDYRAPNKFGELFAKQCCIAEMEHQQSCRQGLEKPFHIERPETSEPSFVRGDSVWDFNKWYKYNREAVFAGRTIKTWAELYSPLQDEIEGGVVPSTSTTWKSFCDSWGPVDLGRRIITTTKGFIGAALEQSCRDDVVCVLSGFRLPVILRPCSMPQKFEVIGECYIHGLMCGEAMEDLKKGNRQLESFQLC